MTTRGLGLTRFEFTRRVRPLMEVGIGSTVLDEGVGVWDVSLWDSPLATWNGDEPLWRDVSCDVQRASIDVGRGRVMESFPVGTATVEVDNSSGWADPSIDFEDDSVSGYISFPGVSTSYASVDDYAALDLTGDFTLLMRVRINEANLTPGAWDLVSKDDPNDPDDLTWRVGIFNNTDFYIDISPDGTIASAESFQTVALPKAVGYWRWVAFAFDANDGAGGNAGTWWYGGEGDDPTVWQLVETVTWPGTFTMATNNLPMVIMPFGGFMGDIGHFELCNGHGGLVAGNVTVGGTTVFEFNGWDLRDSNVGATELEPRVGPNPIVLFGPGVSVMPASWIEILPDLFDSADPSWVAVAADLYEWTG